MQKLARIAPLTLLLLGAPLIGCGSSEEAAPAASESAATETAAAETTAAAAEAPAEAEQAAIAELSIEEVARRIEAGEAVPVDANGAGTRQQMGTLPGARLLTSSGSFQASELPEDRDTCLVFYCANSHCNASEGAADRARDQGFSNVNVMRAGIAGWVESGQETSPAS